MAERSGQTPSPPASFRAVGSGQHLVLLTVGLVVLAGVLSGAAALWRTNRLNDSYHEALENELEEVGLAYGITASAFVQVLGPDAAPVLAQLTSAAPTTQGGTDGFDNDLLAFDLWVPDATSSFGYRLSTSQTIQDDGGPNEPATIAALVARAGAEAGAAAAVDEKRERIHVAFPIELSPDLTAIVVGTLSAHNEFAFIERQQSDALRRAIVTSIAIFGLLVIVAIFLSRAVSGHLVSRERAEETLRDSEERYRTLAALSPVGIFRADRDANCIYANERACEVIGMAENEVLGQGWAKGLHPDDAERLFTEWSNSDPEAPFQSEYRLMRADGTTVWVLGQRVPEHDEHGAIVRFVGTITDITERKRMEDALREQTRHDPLTGALNHPAIVEELRAVIEQGEASHCTVVMADVDGMKATNDTFGHQMGDLALVTVARAMAAGGAILGRYGGDEFVAVLPGADRAAAERYREQVSADLAEATLTDPETGARVPVFASIGLAIFPDDAETVVDLIKLSDIAMYSMRRQRILPADGNVMPARGDDAAARAIGELVPLLTMPGPLGDKLNRVAHRLCVSAGYDAVNVQLYAPEPGGPAASYTVGSVGERSISAWDAYLAQDGVAVPMRQALESMKRPLIIDALTADERLTPELRWIAAAAGIRAGVVAPLVWRGQVVGSLAVGSKQAKAFGPRDAQFLAVVASQVAAVVQLSRLAGEPLSVPLVARDRAA